MKYSKRYVIFTILMVIGIFTKFHIMAQDNSQISSFRGGMLKEEVWYPMIADETNKGLIKLVIDNREYTNENTPFYMNDARDIMVPVDMLRDALNCSSHIYDDTELLIEKRSEQVTFTLDENTAQKGEELQYVLSGFTKIDDKYYVSINDLSYLLDYNFSYSVEDCTFTTVDTSEIASIVPQAYDLRDKGRVSLIKNQGTYETCWGFAATSALESAMLPEEKEIFSVDHMTMSNSYNVTQYDGGKYTMGMAYLAAWQGPVREIDDPYGDDYSDESLEAVKHVQEMRIIAGKDYEAIKAAVFKYGGVQTSLYSTLRSSNSESTFYNSRDNAYCYIGTEKPNHDVVIIGWDDNYSKDHFSVALEGDGAFICQNSWGKEFGDNGVFYVSYYDTNIGTHNVVYTKVEDTDNYDQIYQSDLCGWVGELGYNGGEEIYGANVFTAKSDETIEAASFYATGANSTYELYVVSDFENENSFIDRKKVAEGSLTDAGYYTINFATPVDVKKKERFAVVLYINTPGSTSPMAVEYDSGESFLEGVKLQDGEGYISKNGAKFENVKSVKRDMECNLCIKAFTVKR